MKRFEPDQVELAKNEGLALYNLQIDRRFLPKHERVIVRSECYGPCPREHYPYLRMAYRILFGISPEMAMLNLHEELKALEAEDGK